MPDFAEIRIPIDDARSLAIRTDKRTALDDGYAIKAFLAEHYGPDVVRPWRIAATEDDEFCVLGVARDPQRLAKPSRAIVRQFRISPEKDDTIEIDVLTTATRRVREPMHNGGWSRREVDVASVRDPDTGLFRKAPRNAKRDLYTRWLLETFSHADIGAKPVDVPDIISMASHTKVRKSNGVATPLLVPCVHARIPLRVLDAGAFTRFLVQGINKMKDIGYGALLPVDLLEAVEQ